VLAEFTYRGTARHTTIAIKNARNKVARSIVRKDLG